MSYKCNGYRDVVTGARLDCQNSNTQLVIQLHRGMGELPKYLPLFCEILTKLDHADTKHADDPMEKSDIPAALGVLECEMAELRREVERVKHRPDLLRAEAVDLAVAAIKFLRDIC